MTTEKKLIVEEQFNEVYSNYKDSIFSFCMAKLHCNVDDSDDCVQETFSVFLKKLKAGESFENPRAFLYKTALNYIKKSQSKESKRIKMEYSLSDENNTIEIVDKLSSLDEKIVLEEINKKMDSILSEYEAKLFDLKFNQDKSIKEIAQIFDITPSNCATQISRMRSKLKTELKEFI